MVSVIQVDTVKRMCVKKLPKVLVIQLKRFDYDWERCVLIVYICGVHIILCVCIDLIIVEKWLSSLMITLNFHENWTCLHTQQQLLLRRKVSNLYTQHQGDDIDLPEDRMELILFVLCRRGPF